MSEVSQHLLSRRVDVIELLSRIVSLFDFSAVLPTVMLCVKRICIYHHLELLHSILFTCCEF